MRTRVCTDLGAAQQGVGMQRAGETEIVDRWQGRARNVIASGLLSWFFGGIRVKRRGFIALLGGAAVTRPLAGRAQQPAMSVIGFLSGATFETMREYVAAFHKGLESTGLSRAAT